MTVAGIVLCGGASRRMGRPKALLDFDGEPLLCRVVRVVSQIVSPVIVVAGPKQTLPELPTGTLIGRDLVEYAGPLVGLAAGLALMPPSASHAFVTACDMPFITANLVRLFVSFAQPNRLLMPVIRNERQPLPGIYPMVITTTIQNQLQAGNSSLRSLWEVVGVDDLNESDIRSVDTELAVFRPMNEPAEYEAAIENCQQIQK